MRIVSVTSTVNPHHRALKYCQGFEPRMNHCLLKINGPTRNLVAEIGSSVPSPRS